MSFLKEYHQLRLSQPRISLVNLNHQNSEYCGYSAFNKNSYLLFGSEHNEECLYGIWVYFCQDSSDCDFIHKCELCYESIDLDQCYNCDFCQDCVNSRDCEHCYDCHGCENCFGCVGLRKKKFHILNRSYSPEKYQQKIAELKKSPNSPPIDFLKEFEKLKTSTPRLYVHQLQNENCAGDYLYNSKNSFRCFDCKELEDCAYTNNCIKINDCIDCSNIYFDCELCYEIMSGINLHNCNFCSFVYDCSDLLYCDSCYNCKNCFGCVTLKNHEYHILNKPYSPTKYKKKTAEIISSMKKDGSWGKNLATTFPEVFPEEYQQTLNTAPPQLSPTNSHPNQKLIDSVPLK